ncbi:unnamed protein product [Phaeothamnion confervicola]
MAEPRAPIRLVTCFLKAVSELRMYEATAVEEALVLVGDILEHEPKNPMMLDYRETLMRSLREAAARAAEEKENDEDDGSSESSSSEEGNASGSDGSSSESEGEEEATGGTDEATTDDESSVPRAARESLRDSECKRGSHIGARDIDGSKHSHGSGGGSGCSSGGGSRRNSGGDRRSIGGHVCSARGFGGSACARGAAAEAQAKQPS